MKQIYFSIQISSIPKQFEDVIFNENHDVKRILKFKLGNTMDSKLNLFIAKNNEKQDEYTVSKFIIQKEQNLKKTFFLVLENDRVI